MPYQPTVNFKLSDGRDLGSLGWITKEYLMTVYPQIAANMITPELWVWGLNNFGQLGINVAGTGSMRCTPVTTFSGGANWKQVATGKDYTAAIKTDGTLWTWGYGFYANLGINIAGATAKRCTPVTVFGSGTNWKQVSCDLTHVAAIKTDGTLWTWGANNQGQLGINDTSMRCTPIVISSGSNNWKQVSCGDSQYTAAVKTDGTLWTWGSNNSGVLGINDRNMRCSPVQVFGSATNWKQVSSGGFHVAAIKTDGTLWIWGSAIHGQLGINVAGATDMRCTPVTTSVGGTNWKQVDAGYSHTAAIKTDGTLWTWGRNDFGQLGINDTNMRCTPVTVFGSATNWKQVACGREHTTAIKADGSLWTWGYNNNGQLGINNTTNILTPVTTFLGGKNWKQVGSKHFHTVAIQSIDIL